MSTTSAQLARPTRAASATSWASPTTSRSRRRTSAARTPSRNNGWSSTSSTRVIVVLPRSAAARPHRGAAPGSRADGPSEPPISSARRRIEARPRPGPRSVVRPRLGADAVVAHDEVELRRSGSHGERRRRVACACRATLQAPRPRSGRRPPRRAGPSGGQSSTSTSTVERGRAEPLREEPRGRRASPSSSMPGGRRPVGDAADLGDRLADARPRAASRRTAVASVTSAWADSSWSRSPASVAPRPSCSSRRSRAARPRGPRPAASRLRCSSLVQLEGGHGGRDLVGDPARITASRS